MQPHQLHKVKKSFLKKSTSATKVRVGIIVGKDFDPVKKGTHWPNYPKQFIFTQNEWGKYSVDVCTALKMKQLHPDILDIDIIPGKEISEKRLKNNHLNLNFWYDIGVAMLSGNRKHIEEVTKCHKNPDCRLSPSWDFYDWILCKPRYMEQCQKAGIPMIPTIIYKNGFDPMQCMKDVQKMGWDKFFVKVGHFAFFGSGAVHGNTQDFLGDRAKDLVKFGKKKRRPFIAQDRQRIFFE